MIAPKNNVLVNISDQLRESIFSTPITDTLGRKFSLLTKYREKKGFDEFFAQGVSVGQVIFVGSNVKGMQLGDSVMMDYSVDINDEYIVHKEDGYKIVSIPAVTQYVEKDKIINPNRRSNKKIIVETKGEMLQPSLVIAAVRGEKVFPVAPYILLNYKDEDVDEFYKNGATWSRSEREPVTEREIISVYEGCDLKPGEKILIESEDIFSRSFGNDNFDVAFDFKVIAIEAEEKERGVIIHLPTKQIPHDGFNN